MTTLQVVGLGILLVCAGAVLLLLTRLLLRAAADQRQPMTKHQEPPRSQAVDLANPDAVLIIEPGGRVIYINPQARKWLGTSAHELPNLEHLARQARPPDTFLDLCRQEGQARFSIQGLYVEGTSYNLPYFDRHVIVLTLRRPQITAFTKSAADQPRESLDILSELSQAMTASLDLEITIKAVLENVDRLIPSDFSEITLWDAAQEQLVPYRYASLSGIDRQLETTTERYAPQEGFSGYLIANRSPLLVPDVDNYVAVRPAIDRQRYPLKSYLGVPLLIANEPMGTLELASLATHTFNENDLEVLRILSGQAAVAIQNARIHQQEQQRVAELTGLAALAQATGTLRDPQDLYERLIQSIKPLIDVEILGLIIYNEAQRSLEGQVPFVGMPDQFVDLYRTEIPVDSPAEEIWFSQETLIAPDAPEDPRLEKLGLAHLAQAAGIRNTALVPLTSSGRPLGYLQAANKRDDNLLSEDDLRLLAIIAGQVGPILENAALVQESRRRTRQAESLRRISSLAASNATLDEILKFSLLELARLLDAEVALLFVLDPDRGELQLHAESLFGLPSEIGAQIERLSLNDPQFRSTVTGSLQPFVSPDVHQDERVLPIYRPLVETLGAYRAVIDVPLEIREQGIGEIILGHRQTGRFNNNDAQLATTAARQLANAIERSSLYTQTDESLRLRLDQLTAQARISRELGTTLDVQKLLAFILNEALLLTQADGGRVLRLSPPRGPDRQPTVLDFAGTPPANGLLPIERKAVESGKAIIVNGDGDVELATEPEFPARLIVPLLEKGYPLGLIHLRARTPGHFDSGKVERIGSLADQAAVVLKNADKHREQVQRNLSLERQVETLNSLLLTFSSQNGEQPLETALESVFEGLRMATTFPVVVFSMYDPGRELLLGVGGAGLNEAGLAAVRAEAHPWDTVQGLLKDAVKVSHSFWVPENAFSAEPLAILGGGLADNAAENGHSNLALLLLPLYGLDGQPLGLISLVGHGTEAPDIPVVEALENIARQAAVSLESHQHVRDLQHQVKTLEHASVRATTAATAAQHQLPMLLHKDLEQTLAIHHLNQRAQRMRAGLDIAEIVNLQPDRSAVLWALGQEMLTRMDLNAALVADMAGGSPRLVHSIGAVPQETNPQALFGQRNPLRQSLQTGAPILVPNLAEDQEWAKTPLLQAMDARGFVCLPIATNGQVDSAILAISHTPLPELNDEDEQIYKLLASQVAITLQNLNLLTETRRRLREVGLLLDFSQQLGTLDPDQILKTLVDSTRQVIKSAHAGLVVLWDENQNRLIPRAAAGYTDNDRILEIAYRAGEALPGQVYVKGKVVHVAEVDFAEQYKLTPENLLLYREATGGRVPVSSLLAPLQAGEITLGVLVLDNFNTVGAFTEDDAALITSLTQQTALTLENARLYQASEERTAQLRSLTDVAATITSSLQTDELINTLLDQLGAILPYDTATLWLRQDSQLTVRAAQGFEEGAGQIGLTVALEDSQLLSEMIGSGEPINVDNVHADARFPALIEHPHLSWLGIPLISKGEAVGVIALEKTEPSYYSLEDVQIATTLAGQATVALENARLYEESLRRTHDLDERSRRLDQLNRISTELSRSLDPDQILQFTSGELRQTLRSDCVSVVLFDEDGAAYSAYRSPRPGGNSAPCASPDAALRPPAASFGVFSTEDISREADLEPLAEFFADRGTQALLLLPLATGARLHGLLAIQSGEPVRYPSSEVELASTITNQAGIALQNARQYEQTRQLTEELEERVVQRTQELAREHQRTQTLLRIITELSASLDLDIIINRTLALINDIAGAEQSTVLLVRPEDPALLYRASSGFTTPPVEGGQPTWLRADEGLAGWVIREQEAVLVPDLAEDARWVTREGQASVHRSAIGVPLLVGAESLGTLMLFHREPNQFSPDLLDLIQATAKQIAVAINNAQLYLLIRDQAERLGATLRSQQIEATRANAILESVADGVLVTDAQDHITLFNAAAENILGLDQSRVAGKSLDEFTGLFGGAARTWMETIRRWSDNPATYTLGDTYAEQIELETGLVVAVSLAPVILRNELLGTVSIFRDITHQVEVDRLKSEFVATVSHELRTPMTSIKGYVDVLLLGAAGELNEGQIRFLEVVKSNTERLNVLVNDLLDVSHIEAGKLSLSLQAIDLREAADQVAANVRERSRLEDKPITVNLHAAPKLPRIFGDPEQVEKILTNLIENAYQYTPEGGRIDITLQQQGEDVQVDIQDTGIGILPEDQVRVFDRFYRGEDPLVLATAGTGLGLSIVRQLVEMHQGRIWLESSGMPNEGSLFSFTLPVYLPPEPEQDE